MDYKKEVDSYRQDHDPTIGFTESEQNRQMVFDKYPRWYSRLRYSCLAVKVDQLWRLFREGDLSRKEIGVVVAALLYCVSPLDLTPDFIPVIGFLDDLLVVLATLAYLERNRAQTCADQKATDEGWAISPSSSCIEQYEEI